MENLTHHNNTIFNEAMKAKREKKLMNVKTIDGQVYVRTNPVVKFSCMKSTRESEVFIAKSSSQINNEPAPYPASTNVPIQQQQIQQAHSSMDQSQTHEQQHQQAPLLLPNMNNQTKPPMET